jgi:hypothetical protein
MTSRTVMKVTMPENVQTVFLSLVSLVVKVLPILIILPFIWCLALVLCILEVSDSNLDLQTEYVNIFHGFPQLLQVNSQIEPYITQRQLLLT